jgi:hypothetical protein
MSDNESRAAARMLYGILKEANPHAFKTDSGHLDGDWDANVVIDGKFDLCFVASEFLRRERSAAKIAAMMTAPLPAGFCI